MFGTCPHCRLPLKAERRFHSQGVLSPYTFPWEMGEWKHQNKDGSIVTRTGLGAWVTDYDCPLHGCQQSMAGGIPIQGDLQGGPFAGVRYVSYGDRHEQVEWKDGLPVAHKYLRQGNEYPLVYHYGGIDEKRTKELQAKWKEIKER